MAIAQPIGAPRFHARRPAPLSSFELYQPLEALLIGGGDTRLTLSRTDRRNAYGCTPYPRGALLEFSSSTASCISERGYARAHEARGDLLARSAVIGLDGAFRESVEEARLRLKHLLDIPDAEIIFSPSGTDAQLQALFLAKEILGGPLLSIIVGADQTGSGTAHTALGRHFSGSTARGIAVQKGAPVTGLSGRIASQEIAFCDNEGQGRGPAEMDHAVFDAVEQAVRGGAKVLLQVMDSSKLGWRGPSDACVDAIMTRWPDQVRVVVDACQMRAGAKRLGAYLARGFLVLITGSKFFGGPAFSGALLVPPSRAAEIDPILAVPLGLYDYGRRFDWPLRWPRLRDGFAEAPNYGQWLRWEAALAEMGAYYAVPAEFRDSVLGAFAARAPQLFAATSHLALLADDPAHRDPGDEELRHRTIFAFRVMRDGRMLSADACRALHRAMNRDLSAGADGHDLQLASRLCQIGQPVALLAGAVLRVATSARVVTDAWSGGNAGAELVKLAAALEKLDWLAGHPEILESVQDL